MPQFARAALVAAVILLPVAVGEGATGLALGLLAVGFIYAGSRMRMAMSSPFRFKPTSKRIGPT